MRKFIKDFSGYEIDTKGNIYSFKTTGKKMLKKSKKMAPHKLKNGYLQISFCIKGKNHKRLIHRLVLETFVGACPPGVETCHNNGVRTDNRLENLRWDTRKNNAKDKVKHGTLLSGEKCHTAKLTPRKVDRLRFLRKNKNLTFKKLGIMFDISTQAAWMICVGKNWKHRVQGSH